MSGAVQDRARTEKTSAAFAGIMLGAWFYLFIYPGDLLEFWLRSCRYASELTLPTLPEMVFPSNSLRVEHKSGCGLVFITLDSLKMVDTTQDPLKVAVAEAWSKTRYSHC